MEPLSPAEILSAFALRDRRNVPLPVDPPWSALDFLGWIHRSGHLGFIVVRTDGRTCGLALERTVVRSNGPRRLMCDICCTLHERGGVASFTRWNRARTHSHSRLLCAYLACSLYVRDLRQTGCAQMPETLNQAEKIARLELNLERVATGFARL